MRIPTLQELADQNLTNLEGSVAQTAPLQQKAFLRVLAVMEALASTGLYKLAIERALQNFAMTATGEDLDLIGEGYGVLRKAAEPAQLSVTISAVNGIEIPITTSFTGDANGVRFNVDAPVVAAGGSAILSVTAEVEGAEGNLQEADTLTIVSPLPGVDTAAVVASVMNTGADEETDEEYRPRVLTRIQEVRGGGNATDYKRWAEEVAGVQRAFPYAGKPVGGGTSYPGDRTVYIQCTSDLDADGVPGVGLLAEVRAALNADPLTGKSRPGLGLIDSTLYVEAIERGAIDVTINGLVTPPGTETDVRNTIEAALTIYLLLIAPYIAGVDLPQDQNDTVTTPAISAVMQGVLGATGSSAAGISFDAGGGPTNSYTLTQGQLVKLGSVTYVV